MPLFLWFNVGKRGDEMSNALRKIFNGIGEIGAMADAGEVVKSLGVLLGKTLKVRWAAVYYFDRDRRCFDSAVPALVPERDIPLFNEVFGALGFVPRLASFPRSRHPLRLKDGDLPLPRDPAARKLLHSLVFLVVPMVVRNEVTGAVLVARSSRRGEFTGDEAETVKSIASHAALVINHIRLVDESLDLAIDLARRIDVILSLDEINKAISSSLSQKEIMETAIGNLERMTGAAVVAVLQEVKGELTTTASQSSIPEAAQAFLPGTRPLLGRCSIRSAFRKGQNCTADVSANAAPGTVEERLRDAGIVSLIVIPLMNRDRITGVLVLGDPERGKFTQEVTFTAEKIAAQVAVALENARLFEDLKNLFFSTVASLANAIDAKSPWTKGHSERVMHTSGRIAEQMGLPAEMVERIKIGGLLHDIGKIGIIENLLEKPDSLSESESPSMRLHPVKGVAILAPIEQLRDVLPAILHHHERYDGKGYPDGLKGEEIPLPARIVTVADAFDAMVAVRPYKEGRPVEEALRELQACAGSQFDPQIVDVFVGYVRRNWRQVRRETGEKGTA
jgi:HD-GYP domain-containing protein (c-di-GMP phosphodiesterase class II)